MAIQRAQNDKRRRSGLREAQRRFTAQHILDAAIDVFVERGYIASTVEHVIDRAGTSRRTFYAHFNSKAHVLIEIANTLLPEIEENYRRLDAALGDGSRESLHAWLLSMIDWCRRYGGLLPVWHQAETIEPALEAQREHLVDRFSELMPAYFARWSGRRDEPRLRLVLLSVQLDRFWAYWPPMEMDEAARALVAEVLTNIWYPALQAEPVTAARSGSGEPRRRRSDSAKQPAVPAAADVRPTQPRRPATDA